MTKPILHAVERGDQKSIVQIAREDVAMWRAKQPETLPFTNQQTEVRGEQLEGDEKQRQMQINHIGKK